MNLADCPAYGNPVVQHTRATDYGNHGCRCDAARRDRERHRKQQHLIPPRRVDITGTRRRLQALMAIGHSQNDLNEALGRKRSGGLGPLLWTPERTTCSRALFENVRDLYNRLWDTPGNSTRTKRAAAAHGWPPPLWWDDDDIDNPNYVVNYKAPRHSKGRNARRAERIEQVAAFTQRGYSSTQIAAFLGIHPRQVQRDRTALREKDAA